MGRPPSPGPGSPVHPRLTWRRMCGSTSVGPPSSRARTAASAGGPPAAATDGCPSPVVDRHIQSPYFSTFGATGKPYCRSVASCAIPFDGPYSVWVRVAFPSLAPCSSEGRPRTPHRRGGSSRPSRRSRGCGPSPAIRFVRGTSPSRNPYDDYTMIFVPDISIVCAQKRTHYEHTPYFRSSLYDFDR